MKNTYTNDGTTEEKGEEMYVNLMNVLSGFQVLMECYQKVCLRGC